MDGEDSVEVDPQELQETLQTYRKLADDFANHDTILKVSPLVLCQISVQNIWLNFSHCYNHLYIAGQNGLIVHSICLRGT